MNDPKLKLAMAKLLPERITADGNYWKGECPEGRGFEPCILETEWLYVMHLVEQTLSLAEHTTYCNELYKNSLETRPFLFTALSDLGDIYYLITSTFNQRATAMCKVKGIII